jgi:PAS domain S-box-containing protein
VTPSPGSRAEVDQLRALVAELEGRLAESRRSEDRLQEHAHQFRSAFEESPVGMAIHALDGRYLRVNPALCAMLRYSADELCGLPIDAACVPEDRQVRQDGFRQLLGGEVRAYQGRQRLVRKGGGDPVWALVSWSLGRGRSGDPVHVIAQVEDISPRVEAEAQLELLAAAVEAAANAIVITDRDGVILWVNSAFTALTGYSAEETVGKTPRILNASRQDRAFYENMWSTILSGRVWHGEMVNRRRDDTLYTESQTITPVRNAQGTVSHFIAIKLDVTALRQTEANLEHQRETLYQSEKLAAMGQLLAGVAHELNNPLAVVIGQAYLLSQRVAEGPLSKRVGTLITAAERCGRIVRNFLALARQFPPERQPVSLNQVVQEGVELLGYSLRVDSVKVVLDLAEDLPTLWADAHQLHQVVVNLVGNAHHAMRQVPGPLRRLTLSTRPWPDGGGVRLDVADTGPGVPPEIQRRIFEPFFTTKAPGQGTGLGLSLCQGIVGSHSGRMGLESAAGQGAHFWVDLPVGTASASPAAAMEVALPRITGRRILVVDDESEVGDLMREILGQDGHSVDVCTDGHAALAKLETGEYDVILSDIRMPELDGPGLYQALERDRHHLIRRFVFVTGDVLDPATKALIEKAMVPSLHKPFTADALRDVVQRALQPMR